jgi:hypothetical protein
MNHRISIKQVRESVDAWDAARKHPQTSAFNIEGDIVFADVPSKPGTDEHGPGLIEIHQGRSHEHQ